MSTNIISTRGGRFIAAGLDIRSTAVKRGLQAAIASVLTAAALGGAAPAQAAMQTGDAESGSRREAQLSARGQASIGLAQNTTICIGWCAGNGNTNNGNNNGSNTGGNNGGNTGGQPDGGQPPPQQPPPQQSPTPPPPSDGGTPPPGASYDGGQCTYAVCG